MEIIKRPQWRTRVGFILAAVGSAIGLGNIWRFPYLCYKNGGGAFLIPYFLGLFLIGIPIMVMEIGLGHKMRKSAPASFALLKGKWEWLGWWQLTFATFGILLYYSVVIAWCVNFFVYSFNLSWGADPNTFFFKEFLSLSKGPFEMGSIRGSIILALALVWFMNWGIVFFGIEKGLERANKIFVPLLFLLTAILVIWSLRLEGAKEGLSLYLRPDFSKLKDIKVWMDAFSQIFFTLSLAFGIMIAYASYLPERSSIFKDSVTISLTNNLFSVFAGLGVFSVLGYMAHATGKPVGEVVSQSIGLAFVTYPKAISLLPFLSRLFGLFFFGSLVLAGLSSAISLLEAFTAGVIDKFGFSRRAVVSFCSVAGFLGGIVFATQGGLFWLDIVDHFLTQYGLVIGGILECLLVAWIWKASSLREHINRVGVWRLPRLWDWDLKLLVTLVLALILINASLKEFSALYGGYPLEALLIIGVGWLIATFLAAWGISLSAWRVPLEEG